MPRAPKATAAQAKEIKQEAGKVVKVKKAPAGKGQASGNAQDKATAIKELEERRRQMKDQLQQVEVQIFNLETQYIEQANPKGNALKGYDGLISSVAANAKKAGLKQEDRIFSNSSVTGTLA